MTPDATRPAPAIELAKVERTTELVIVEDDFTMLQSLAWLTTELHTNEVYMQKESEFGHRIMSGPINFALVSGMWSSDLASPFAERYGITLGEATRVEMRFRRPLMIGDTVVVESQVESVEASATGTAGGVVVFADRAVNQRGETAIETRRWIPFVPSA